ncbi:septal ring lytic transglycosylase RlpA family protein [Thermocrinis minervae]|uniref:Probable endolytic peptidoglycan transglycosylase RlpA n=1 Tax=Thermocrinis minervae TaxID=381751 RepID=A0A1M6T618_9AQUI|nr:septal ring lytic transglycosylase RlpA family protein [Thermocrinis minervae]SHK52354.1 rare lipoprotein A [Thermocrinis minervae]
MIWFLFLVFISSCAVKVEEREKYLEVNCPKVIRTTARYCEYPKAFSNLVQTGSKVKVTNEENGKHITIAVFRREDVEGLCLPYRYSNYLGKDPFRARLEVERCGKEGIVRCPSYVEGYASWYGEPYHGRESAYGTVYNMMGMYAASRDLPLGTLLEVQNLENNKKVVVKVVDRGPLKDDRILDLSYGAAKELGMLGRGVIKIRAKVLRCGD